MSLEHAILGFLRYKPFSGYDLKKVFDRSVQHFWPADQSQIYRTLGRLTERGWAEMELIEQADRPNRKVYHITEGGQEELRDWLRLPLPPQELRSASLVQVFFAGQLSDEEILPMFEHAAAELRGILERYDRIPDSIHDHTHDIDSPREAFFWMLTLESGISTARAQLNWVESVIQRFKDKQVPTQREGGTI